VPQEFGVAAPVIDEERLILGGAREEPVGKDFLKEGGLGAEVVLHRAGAHSSALGNVSQGRRFEPPFPKDEGGGVQDFPGTFSGAALPPRGLNGLRHGGHN